MRAFACFLGVILLAGCIGAVLAYPAYQMSLSFAPWAFHRVASRIAMLVLIAELVWLCRYLKLRQKRDFGYGLPWRRFMKTSLLWAIIGVATACLGAAFLLVTHLRVRNLEFIASVASILRIFFIGVGSGIGVALLEETVFRGLMHTAIERESGPWFAALSTAPLFAVLHLFAKARIPEAELGWSSGFNLLLLSFAPLSHPTLVLDSLLSWLTVGLILSLTRVLTGNIAVAIGLHAGWVIVLRMLQLSTDSGSSPSYSIWVGRFDGLVGYWLLPWGIAIAAVLWFTRGSWVAYATGSTHLPGNND